jgi:hypothetical protein
MNVAEIRGQLRQQTLYAGAAFVGDYDKAGAEAGVIARRQR